MTPAETISITYELLEELGRGPTFALYSAQQGQTDRPVTIAWLGLGEAVDQIALLRCFQEALTASGADPRHIVAVHEVGWTEGRDPFLVTEALEGISLRSVLDREPFLPPAHVAALGLQLCRALEGAHGAGVLHLALSPECLFLEACSGPTEVVRVFGFGLHHLAPADGGRGGSPYQAPETSDLDERADVYALGAILYELLTGVAPGLVTGELKPPSALRPRGVVPEGLSAAIARALSRTREGRLASADALAAALAPFAELVALESPSFETIPAPPGHEPPDHEPPEEEPPLHEPPRVTLHENDRRTIPAEGLIESSQLLEPTELLDTSALIEATALVEATTLPTLVDDEEEGPKTVPYKGAPPPLASPPPPVTLTSTTKQRRSRRGAWLLGALVLLVIAGGSVAGLSLARSSELDSHQEAAAPTAPTKRPTAPQTASPARPALDTLRPAVTAAVVPSLEPTVIASPAVMTPELHRDVQIALQHLQHKSPERCLRRLGSAQGPAEVIDLRVRCLEAAGRQAEACQVARDHPDQPFARSFLALRCQAGPATQTP